MKPKLIVNTNRIIAALIKDSFSRNLLYHLEADFLGVGFSKKEVNKYKDYIIKKAKITEQEFENLLEKICSRIIFIDEELLKLYREEAKNIMLHIDPGDVVFIAAALAAGADIWSDDPHFTKQKKIKVWRTAELSNLL
ncbi:hypothetical protein J4450_00650 [Candidatus Micrarchaeota archaeon]|nr:hypothetical protein [Candidatus Micrarchaeota archaeon]